jgi:hypothetical protein
MNRLVRPRIEFDPGLGLEFSCHHLARGEIPCPITNSIVARARNPLLRSCGWLTMRKGMSSARTAVAGKSSNAGQPSPSSRLGRAREGSPTGVTTITLKAHGRHRFTPRTLSRYWRTPAFVIKIPRHRSLRVESAPLCDQGAAAPVVAANPANRKL